jgi:alkylation response protein AidB-like acyl-CoA dehydrogenase
MEDECLVAVELGRTSPAFRSAFGTNVGIGSQGLVMFGTDAQKQKYLPGIASGEIITSFALTEPEAGSDSANVQTRAILDGDHYVLNGSKAFISGAGVSDVYVCMVRTGEDGSKGISCIVVEKGMPGLSFGKKERKMGWNSQPTAQVIFDNCRVPVANRIGAEGEGFRIAMGTLVSGRLSVAAGSLGVIEDCLAETITYAKERRQHGKEIARHQLVQEHIAAIEMHRVSSDAMVMEAARAKDAITAAPDDAGLKRQADLLAAQAKLFVSNAAWDAADRAVQVFGGRGWSTLYRPGRHMVDVRVCRIYEGTDEILKLKIAAAVLGKEYEAFK